MKSKVSYIAAMLIFGSIGLPVRALGLPSGWVAYLRGVLDCLFLLALHRPKLQGLRKNLLPLAVSGAAIGLNWICLFEAYRYTTVAVATLIYYLAPVLVLLAAPFLLKERLTPFRLLTVVLALVGMGAVSGVLPRGRFHGGAGILLAAAAAVLYATVILINRFIREMEAVDRTFYQLTLAALAVFPYALLREGVLSPARIGLREGALLLLLGVVYTGLAYWLYFEGVGNLPSHAAAMLAYLDPVAALVLSALVLREGMNGWQIGGAVLILGTLIWSEWRNFSCNSEKIVVE